MNQPQTKSSKTKTATGLEPKTHKDGVSDLIKCKICGESHVYLTPHLKEMHNLTSKEYKAKFPNSRLTGRRFTEYGAARSAGTDTDRIACAVCGQTMTAMTGTHTRGHGMTLPEYRAKFPDVPWKVPRVQKVQSEKARAHVLKQNQDPEFKESLRRGVQKTRDMGYGTPHYTYTSKGGASLTLRSKMEICVAAWLDYVEETWEYEATTYRVTDVNGKEADYLPDFFIPRLNKYIEVKSKYIVAMNKVGWNARKTYMGSRMYVVSNEILKDMGLHRLHDWMESKKRIGDTITYEEVLKTGRLSNVLPLSQYLTQFKTYTI